VTEETKKDKLKSDYLLSLEYFLSTPIVFALIMLEIFFFLEEK